MSKIFNELTLNHNGEQSTPAPPSPSTKSLKGQISKLTLIRNLSVTTENHPFAVLTIHQVLILVCSIILMIIVLQIPTVLYFNSIAPSSARSTFTDQIDFRTCSVITNRTLITSTSQSSIVDYCHKIPPLVSQDETLYNFCLTRSLDLVQAIQGINSVLRNKQCNNTALPFFCDAMFLLCGDDNSTVDLREECIKVRDDDCPIEWRVLENILDATLLSCESYTTRRNITLAKAPPLTCPSQFDVFCGSVCLPVCEKYSQVSYDATIASNVLIIMFIIIGILGGCITLMACFFNRDKMFKFPQIYVVYNTVNMLIILFFFVLPLIFDRHELLCSDSNLIVALENPSSYCQAQGFVLQTGILYFFGFLLFHLAHLFFAIAFPLKAKHFMTDHSRLKIAHAAELIIVLVLGLIPGVIIVSTSKYQIDGFLPDLCAPSRRDVLFYTLLLPIVIGSTIGLTMLFTAFWILRRNHQVNTIRSNEEQLLHKPNAITAIMKVLCTGFSSPEKKLFILFWYYILVLIVLLTYFMVKLLTADSVNEQLQNYVSCSLGGYKPECDTYRKKIENITWPSYYLDLASTLLLCSITLSNLTYVLQIIDIKKLFSKLFKSKTPKPIPCFCTRA